VTAERPLRLEVPESAAGERLDAFLAGRLEVTRNRVQGWIRSGRVTVADSEAKPALRLAGGERIECRPLAVAAGEQLVAEAGELSVLHEDGAIVVIDKPAGLAMHPGAGRAGGTLANRLLAAYPEMASVGGRGRPGIVHRLDIDTTGVVVLARSEGAYLALSSDFAARRVEKSYLAVCYGTPREPRGEIARPIGRHPTRRKEMTVRADGRAARTSYSVVASNGGASLLHVGLETGRTHQVRVHLKAAGHPLVGDPVYGEARWKALSGAARAALRSFPRPALHAWTIALRHPTTGVRCAFTAPPPGDLRELWAAVGGADLDATLAALARSGRSKARGGPP
jgi:23S rRNA pseudouridine1911/1915/1917 synthase